MKIIYGVCSWGLGHATRSLPVIRKLIDENNKVTVISHGRSLELLRKELGDNAKYVEIRDYPMLLSENSRQFMAKSMVYWPTFLHRINMGLSRLTKMLKHQKYDRIISDARYDIYSKKIPSFFISHQIRIMNPLRLKRFERGSELFNLFFFKRYAGVIVPDYKKNDLSGELSHKLHRINEDKLHYIGVLSDFKKKNVRKDIDYLISISGPEPSRTMLEEKLLKQISSLKGKIVVTLGKTENIENFKKEGIETHTFLLKNKREELLNRAKLVVSRSGYSTILDLAVIGTKAIMTPTPGQIEQEYLAEYHNKKGTFYSINQNKINLINDVEKAKKTKGVTRKCDVKESVEKIINIMNSYDKSPFR
jgi:uncharacterized protein (TIGR00661 family)